MLNPELFSARGLDFRGGHRLVPQDSDCSDVCGSEFNTGLPRMGFEFTARPPVYHFTEALLALISPFTLPTHQQQRPTTEKFMKHIAFWPGEE